MVIGGYTLYTVRGQRVIDPFIGSFKTASSTYGLVFGT
jgi:hypothetical protein